MLILNRKREQSIIIEVGGVFVRVKVLGGERDRVKLGLEAPESVSILREELLEDEQRRGVA